MRKPNPNQHQANQTTALKILKQVGWQVLDCLLYIGSVVVFFTHVILGCHNCQKTLHEKNKKKCKKGPQRPRRLAASFPKKVQFCGQQDQIVPSNGSRKRNGGEVRTKRKRPPPETENKGIFAQDKARKKRERRRTCLRKVLPYTSNFSSNLCRCVFLASEP